MVEVVVCAWSVVMVVRVLWMCVCVSSCFGFVRLFVEWVVDVLSTCYEMRIALMGVILVCFQCGITSDFESSLKQEV